MEIRESVIVCDIYKKVCNSTLVNLMTLSLIIIMPYGADEAVWGVVCPEDEGGACHKPLPLHLQRLPLRGSTLCGSFIIVV